MKNIHVLIVDDEVDLLEAISCVLEEKGFRCTKANNGRAALNIFEECQEVDPIVAIMSDINMPELGGIEFLQELRTKGYETPFVFLSGYGDKEKLMKAVDLGAYSFLEKPVKNQEIIDAVSLAVEHGAAIYSLGELTKEILTKGTTEERRRAYSEAHEKLIATKYRK
ncbi:MAG: response regulator [Oligoflexia bacterium]|nr:response regulator [Oligoflexia bacterium]